MGRNKTPRSESQQFQSPTVLNLESLRFYGSGGSQGIIEKSAVLQIENERWKAGFLIRNGCEWDGYYWVNYDDRPGSQLCAELDDRVSVLLFRH